MDIFYHSTRNKNERVTASQAILKGLADDGGLFVPETMPVLDRSIEELCGLSYREVAFNVMKLFLTDYTEEELKDCINKAYDSKFDTDEIAPITYADGAYYLELFHGATIAFKDMALSILPHLMTKAAKKNELKEEIVILTATSGDTGKAALAGFADVPGTKIIVFYPKDGVSPVQEKQMVTQKGANTHVIGIKANFDMAQSGVKAMFNNKELAKRMKDAGFVFSSANSINIGRLIPQVCYYVYSYVKLLNDGRIAKGDKINVVVPTGNFGNILAAYYAKLIGTPIDRLICASNINKVLFDFFNTGTYDKNREFVITSSPSMDILISSNLERLIYRICGEDCEKTSELMKALSENGSYDIDDTMKQGLSSFFSGFADEEETAKTIKDLYNRTGYVIDTHTAVAAKVYNEYVKKTGDKTVSIIASTASPYKFAKSVLTAIRADYNELNDIELIDELEKISNTKVPKAIDDIRNAAVLHNTVCQAEKMQEEVEKYLGL
ncbi:MAG: threonine synthase [Lachnospiraceae bacterium]|nr:threonine synthase [Lachnospiraceae bacterium]